MRFIAIALIVLVAASVLVPAVEKATPLGILAVAVIVLVLVSWRRPSKKDPATPERER